MITIVIIAAALAYVDFRGTKLVKDKGDINE